MCMNLETDYVKATAEKVEEIILSDEPGERGGILAFFAEAGQAERASRILAAKGSAALQRAQLYQLHGRLQLEDQRKVFNHNQSKNCRGCISISSGSISSLTFLIHSYLITLTEDRRQVIFATNVAETSITVPNITVVVDSGVCKEQRFDPLRKVTVLKIGKVSQSSARQRMGRAGRTAPGTCYRMYSQV